ncbi:MAG: GNAT family N-acetyltransferase [bacterium]
MVATRAGMGWIGKTDLLVTHRFGPRVRLASVLTTSEIFDSGKPIIESQCGDCTICIENCPARAATGTLWKTDVYRNEYYDPFKCRDFCRQISEKTINKKISLCGICLSLSYRKKKLIEINEAKKIHIPEIIEIWKEFMDFHRDIDPFFARRENAHHKIKQYLRESVRSRKSQVLIALDGRQIAAYSLSRIAEYPPVFKHTDFGFISDMAVKHEYQRQGVGKYLLDEIEKWFAEQGVKRVELEVASKNEIGKSFWAKHGFREYKSVMFLEI